MRTELFLAVILVAMIPTATAAADTLSSESTEHISDGATHETDTAILVSTENVMDTFIAAGPATTFGLPVLTTDRDTLPNQTVDTLDAVQPDEVILVGGPAVISADVADELDGTYDVIRLWGSTKIGTSAAVAEYFWPDGEDRAVVVQSPRYGEGYWEDTFERMLQVRPDISGNPVVISDTAGISYRTVEAVAAVDASSVLVISDDPPTTVEDPFDGIGVENVTTLWKETELIKDRWQDQSRETYRDADRVQVVAAASPEDAAGSAAYPDTVTVTEDSDMDAVISLIEDIGPETVFLTGDDRQVDTVEPVLEAELDATVTSHAGDTSGVTDYLVRERWHTAGSQKIEDAGEPEDGLGVAADQLIDRAAAVTVREKHREAFDLLTSARQYREQGGHAAAARDAVRAYMAVMTADLPSSPADAVDRNEYNEQIQQEMRSVRQAADQRRMTVEGLLREVWTRHVSPPGPEDAYREPAPEPGDPGFEAEGGDGAWISYENPRDLYRHYNGSEEMPQGSGKICITLLNEDGEVITGESIPETTVTVPTGSNMDWHLHTPFTVEFPLTEHYDVPLDADQFGTSPDLPQGDGYMDSHCLEWHAMPETATITYDEATVSGPYSEYVDVVGYVQQEHTSWDSDIDPLDAADPYDEAGGWQYHPDGSHGQAVVILQIDRTGSR